MLIVDDEPGHRPARRTAWRQVGFAVLSIHDRDRFEKALERIRPTVVFLAINMPNRGGLEQEVVDLLLHMAVAVPD